MLKSLKEKIVNFWLWILGNFQADPGIGSLYIEEYDDCGSLARTPEATSSTNSPDIGIGYNPDDIDPEELPISTGGRCKDTIVPGYPPGYSDASISNMEENDSTPENYNHADAVTKVAETVRKSRKVKQPAPIVPKTLKSSKKPVAKKVTKKNTKGIKIDLTPPAIKKGTKVTVSKKKGKKV